ncbi:MAG: branched-chain amino acid transport system II carrier protein [Arsenophonus endosymbiont of Ceratovacuna japonica]
MTYNLTYRDIIALGFMTFALFIGAGNIIFPPIVGLQSGEKIWTAAAGFLLTGVGLPVITIIALAKVGGSIDQLSAPIGKYAGLLLAIIIYLFIGILFATPRTASVSYEVGITPLVYKDSSISLFIYNIIYFLIVIIISLYPGKLLNNIGYILAPIKMIALAILGITAIIWPIGKPIIATPSYAKMAFSNGFIHGYLTMDTLGAMIFSIIIVNTIRSRGIENSYLLTRYTIWAGLIAGLLLTLVYISLFKLGNNIGTILPNTNNGIDILYTYVQHIFGKYGNFFLGILIFIACIVTAIGLICACAEFFTLYIPISYSTFVWILGICSMILSNLGLNNIINYSIPILITIYPPCIILIIMSFTLKWWKYKFKIAIISTMLISLLFSLFSAIKYFKILESFIPIFIKKLPFYDYNLTWLIPSLIILALFAIYDYIIIK